MSILFLVDFLGGIMNKNPPAKKPHAGDMGLVPSPGRFHMAQSNRAYAPLTTESVRLKPILGNEKSLQREALALQ